MNDALLSIRDLSVSYGAIQAVRGVSLEAREGEIVTLIGANGAGKSSILRAISGVAPYQGSIVFSGAELRGRPAHAIVRLGIAHVPEGRGIFGNLTVNENLRLAAWTRSGAHEIARDQTRVFDIFPRLAERRHQPAGTLSGGEQQMLALGRGLMTGGKLMLLDEPSMGLSPVMARDIFRVLAEIGRQGMTMLLVEQNARMALRLASRGYVLETGRVILQGASSELNDNPRVKEAYLGG